MDHRKYVKGDLVLTEDIAGLRIYCDNDLVCERSIYGKAKTKSKIKNTMELMKESKNLLQVAEMFYDGMKGTDQEGSLPFHITENILKRLKTR